MEADTNALLGEFAETVEELKELNIGRYNIQVIVLHLIGIYSIL